MSALQFRDFLVEAAEQNDAWWLDDWIKEQYIEYEAKK